jgi:hypothetical protein
MAETSATTTTPKPKARPKTAAKKTTTARKATPVTPSTPVQRVQDAAEKAVLVQVGAALIARDHVVDAVTGIAGTDLKSAERRGAAVRKDLEARVRKTRTAVTKRATANRKRVEHDIKSLRAQFEARAASPRAAVDQIVETGRTVGAKVADRVPKVPTRA